jgi:hypothetical protein
VRVANPGMRVSNSDVKCTRVSSLLIFNERRDTAVEVGWYESPVGAPQGCTTTNGNPRAFGFIGVSGATQCVVSGHWLWYRNGSVMNPDGVPVYIANFTTGTPFSNGERRGNDGLSDSAYSMFDGLQRYDATPGQWSGWLNTVQDGQVTDDPDYNACVVSNTKTEVRLAAC